MTTTRTRTSRPSSLLMLLAGSSSPLRMLAMTAWILLLAVFAMGTFAAAGAFSSLRALWANGVLWALWGQSAAGRQDAQPPARTTRSHPYPPRSRPAR